MPSHIKVRNLAEQEMLRYILYLSIFENENKQKPPEYISTWRLRILDEIQNLRYKVSRVDRMPLSEAKEQVEQYHIILESKINQEYIKR